MNKNLRKILLIWAIVGSFSIPVKAQESEELPEGIEFVSEAIFDDRRLLDGYAEKYKDEPRDVLLAMINDESLNGYKMSAAITVLKEMHIREIISREKKVVERLLWRRLNRTDSAFVQVETMHALVKLDRYKYFQIMVPDLIRKMDHYNNTVSVMAFQDLLDITAESNNRPREARIVFNTLRKVLFLSRNRLQQVKEPSDRLKQKLDLLRWSVKVLGTEELRQLPSEVIGLL